MKQEIVDGVVYQYDSAWTHKLENERHWRAYWWQQKLMEAEIKPGHHVLEIGVGTAFTANYLRSKGIQVTTIDIDESKSPDIIANIVNYDWPQQYDHVLAFEVFEHIPFEQFTQVLHRLADVSKNCLFLSVPANQHIWLRCELHLPRIGMRQLTIATPKRRITTPTHFWEVGYGQMTQPLLETTFTQAGFQIQQYRKFFTWMYYKLRSSKI